MPRTLVWDGDGAIRRRRSGSAEPTAGCQGFLGVSGTKVIALKVGEPKPEGIVERAHDYLEKSFLPARTFAAYRIKDRDLRRVPGSTTEE